MTQVSHSLSQHGRRKKLWLLALCAGLLTSACETPEDKEIRERQQRYTQMTGLPAGSVVSVVQKGFSAGTERYWIYYFEDRVSSEALAEAPIVICETQQSSTVKTSKNEPTSELLQQAQPTLKKLLIRCVN